MTLTVIKTIDESKTNNPLEKGSVYPQVLAILAGSLAAFTNGVIFAWTSPFLVKIVEDDNYNITEGEASYITIIQPVSMIFSTILFFQLCDIIGRKKALLLITIPQSLCLLTAAFARSAYVFYLSRVFAGSGNVFLWVAMPMYIGEVATPKVRGIFGNSITSAVNVGNFAVNLVGSYCSIATTSYIFLVVPILFLVMFSLMPESPYYFLIKKDYKSANDSLRFLTGKKNVDNEFNEIKSDVERQMSESGCWKDLVLIESNRKALLVGVFLRLSQQFGGVTVFIQYLQYIFQKSGGNVSPQNGSMIISGLVIVLNILVVAFVVHRFSRKALYTTSLFFCTIVLLIMSAYFYIDEMVSSIDISTFNWLPMAIMISYQISSSFGVQIIPSLMSGELFSASVKAKAMTILLIVLSIGLVLSNAIFNLLNEFIGSYAPFLFFSVCSAISTVFSAYIIPETKGKTLEQIQMSFKLNK